MSEERNYYPVEEPEEEEAALSGADAFKVDLYFWLQALVMALVGLILIFIGVDGESMMPTLHDRDMLLLQSIGYSPEQGDVVVLSTKDFRNGSPIVKRIIAVGGQVVDINNDDGLVYVDGEPLQEPYTDGLPSYRLDNSIANVTYPYRVPEGELWVMGDNRTNSQDSRYFGSIDRDTVTGRGALIYWPLDHFGLLE